MSVLDSIFNLCSVLSTSQKLRLFYCFSIDCKLPDFSYNLFHCLYFLQSKLPSKGLLREKHDPVGRTGDKRPASLKESDHLSVTSVGSDLPYVIDRKEKFKMVIGKSKKDGQEPSSKDTQPQMGVSMDAAAAAAILQAATRGIRNPSLEIFTKTSTGNGQGLGSDGSHLSGYGSLLSSQPESSVQKSKQNAEASVSVPVAKVIAETAAIAAAGEADSSEACMSKEKKLKAERLKRAKMFAAMIKSGAAPLKSEPVRGLSAEPPGSGISGSGAGKEREGSSVPYEAFNSDKSPKSEEKLFVDNTERRSKRKYRSRSSRHEEGEEEDKKDHKRSRRKHQSHRSSHSSRDRHKHKRRHSSSRDRDSKRTKHDSSSDDDSRDHHKYDSSSDEKHHSSRRQHRERNSSDNEHQHSRRRHKSYSSSDDQHRHQCRAVKHRSRSQAEREIDLEEGEINLKPDQSKASDGGCASREASVELSKSYHHSREPSQPSETTDISDELRAKIRAMLMATL